MKKILSIFTIILNLEASSYEALLFHGNCVTCHFEQKSISAPSVVEFKQRYLQAFPKKEEFIEYMATWIEHPNAKTSLMNDAIIKYELMPELGFDIETVREISQYIYETDFTKPHEGH